VKRVSHDWEVGSRGVSDGRIPERVRSPYGDCNEDGEDDKSGKGQGQKHGTTGDNGKKNASLWTWATWF
jgi:hypothetical protein